MHLLLADRESKEIGLPSYLCGWYILLMEITASRVYILTKLWTVANGDTDEHSFCLSWEYKHCFSYSDLFNEQSWLNGFLMWYPALLCSLLSRLRRLTNECWNIHADSQKSLLNMETFCWRMNCKLNIKSSSRLCLNNPAYFSRSLHHGGLVEPKKTN